MINIIGELQHKLAVAGLGGEGRRDESVHSGFLVKRELNELPA